MSKTEPQAQALQHNELPQKSLANSKGQSFFSGLAYLLSPITSAALLVGLLVTANHANAESYFSIDGSSVSLENETDSDLTAGGMRFRMGTQISEVFDIEGQLGFSFDKDTESYDGLGAAYMGAYLKGYIPVGHFSALYGLAGWSNVSLSQEVGQGEFTEERSGFSWGFGLETQLTTNLDITADYMSYVRNEGLFTNVSALSVGLKLYF